MSMKDILVHVNASPHAQARMETAVRLAKSQNARLTGFYVVTPSNIPDHIRAQLGADIVERQQQAMEQTASRCEEAFNTLCANAGIEFDWVAANGDLSWNLTRQARYYDIVLLGQRESPKSAQPGSERLPDSIVLSSGRPVMIVPHGASPREIGRKLLVAWDGSRQAVRAVSDTLPLLAAAEKVVVVVVNTRGENKRNAIDLTGTNISRHLNRHGINAEARQVSAREHEVGQTLLAQAEAENCDAIVMGAWGHQRWQEIILGGVTRFMVEKTDRPVIMSH